MSRQAVHQWLEHDADFSVLYEQAKEHAKDIVRAEIHRRAVEGWDEPVFYKGRATGSIRKFSDTLLIFRAKALMPDEYRERQAIEHSGPGGGPIQNEVEHRGLEVRAVDYRLTAAPLRPREAD